MNVPIATRCAVGRSTHVLGPECTPRSSITIDSVTMLDYLCIVASRSVRAAGLRCKLETGAQPCSLQFQGTDALYDILGISNMLCMYVHYVSGRGR